MSGNDAILGKMIYNDGSMGILNLTYLNNQTISTNLGENINLSAYLTDDMGNTVTEQNISFYVNETPVGNTTSIEGYANLSYNSSSVGRVPVLGNYSGHGDYPINISQGELEIKIPTNLNLSLSSDNIVLGDSVTLTAKLTDISGDPIPNAIVTFNINGNNYNNSSTNVYGIATYIFTPDHVGEYNINATFANETHRGVSTSKKLTVKSPTPSGPPGPDPDNNNTNDTGNGGLPGFGNGLRDTGFPLIILLVLSVTGLLYWRRK
jgi:hypothetical protein